MRPNFGIHKKKASTPLHRGPKCRCFAALSWGTGRSAASHAGEYTTARCRQCVVQRENLWFSTLCTFSQRAKAESLETQRAVWGKNKGPSDRPGPSTQPYCLLLSTGQRRGISRRVPRKDGPGSTQKAYARAAAIKATKPTRLLHANLTNCDVIADLRCAPCVGLRDVRFTRQSGHSRM